MKKIINGKTYNTETAKKLANWDNEIYGSFDSIEETLYQKRTGEFFLAGEGGARTIYSTPTENGSKGGARIIPLTYSQAEKWAKAKLSANEYEGIFGAIEEDETKVITTISIAKEKMEKAKREAAEQEKTLFSYFESLIG